MPTIRIRAIRNEITGDPETIGYGVKSDQAVADLTISRAVELGLGEIVAADIADARA